MNKTKYRSIRARLARNYEKLICLTPQRERSICARPERRDLVDLNLELQDLVAKLNPEREEKANGR